jgi:hypothetical protein
MIGQPWFFKGAVVVTLLTLLVWLVMLVVTTPYLGALSGGLAIFDLRPGGYDLEDARALVSRLGMTGVDYYLGTQQRLDSIFPLLVAATISAWLMINGFRLKEAGVAGMMTATTLFSLLSMIGAIIDYSENGAIRMILMTPPDSLTAEAVARASAMTQLKFLASGLAFAALLGMLAMRILRQRPNRA